MLRSGTEARCGLRVALVGLLTSTSALAWSGSAPLAAPKAEIVVDGNSGGVLHASNPDALRHPASLTKIMTLYLLFEQLEAGKLKLDTPLKVSEHAASQSPTKLGLRAGTTLSVEDAIKGMVTRSANDAAVVVAEAIGGDERQFAKLMTEKAHALAMTGTIYRNASGLPDDEQVTTARDQSILGRAIQERFPRQYKYFSMRSFSFRGQLIANHNHLLGLVEGVDGIKTGYTQASGFNLVTSVHRGNRYVVAVVMGGSSAGSRDARMRELINSKLALASTKRSAPAIAEIEDPRSDEKATGPRFAAASAVSTPAGLNIPAARTESSPVPVQAATATAPSAAPAPAPVPAAPVPAPATAAETTPATVSGSSEPIHPIVVKTVTVRAGRPRTAGFAPLQVAALPAVEGAKGEPTSAQPTAEPPTRSEPASAPAATADPKTASATTAPIPTMVKAELTAAPVTALANDPAAPAPLNDGARGAAAEPSNAARTKSPPRRGWMIQVGAYPAEEEAKHRLALVQSKAAKVLSGADPFTETIDKGGATYYRARFAGLGKQKAEAACKFLKRNDLDCVAIKN